MTKTDLIALVAESATITKKDATKAVDAIFDGIGEALKKGEKVQLVGFGTFSVKERAERDGLNPRTMEPIKIAASKTPSFKAGKALKDMIK